MSDHNLIGSMDGDETAEEPADTRSPRRAARAALIGSLSLVALVAASTAYLHPNLAFGRAATVSRPPVRHTAPTIETLGGSQITYVSITDTKRVTCNFVPATPSDGSHGTATCVLAP